jgi:hypothetical protein
MNAKLTTIIAGSMLALTGATLPASAIVSNPVSPQTTYENRTPPPPSYGEPTPSQKMSNLPSDRPIQISLFGINPGTTVLKKAGRTICRRVCDQNIPEFPKKVIEKGAEKAEDEIQKKLLERFTTPKTTNDSNQDADRY